MIISLIIATILFSKSHIANAFYVASVVFGPELITKTRNVEHEHSEPAAKFNIVPALNI